MSGIQEHRQAFMRRALELAETAARLGEVPVGAVVEFQGKIIGEGHNAPIALKDPTAHAEIIALRAAARSLGAYRLPEAVVYATLEPCVMCMGAIITARVSCLVYGARDEKAGAAGSVYRLGSDGLLNHRLEIIPGVEAERARVLLQTFFKQRRCKD